MNRPSKKRAPMESKRRAAGLTRAVPCRRHQCEPRTFGLGLQQPRILDWDYRRKLRGFRTRASAGQTRLSALVPNRKPATTAGGLHHTLRSERSREWSANTNVPRPEQHRASYLDQPGPRSPNFGFTSAARCSSA